MRHIILSLIIFLYTIFNAFAETTKFDCKRFYIDSSGFSSLRAAESWYPKNIKFVIDLNKEKAYFYKFESNVRVKSNGKRFDIKFAMPARGGDTYYYYVYFLPIGEVHAALGSKAGLQDAGGGKYKCNNWPIN